MISKDIKRTILLLVLIVSPLTAFSREEHGGNAKVSLGVGVGTVSHCGATFDQHFNMEWKAATMFDKIDVSLGFSINNSYGATIASAVIGSYDYYYTSTTYSAKNGVFTKQVHRKSDVCLADVDASREDINAMFTTSFCYSPISNLDVYFKFGFGAGVMNYVISNIHNEQGVEKVDHDNTIPSGTRVVYKYDDYSHVKWSGYDSKFCLSSAAYIGAVYWFTHKWGAEMQFGMLSSNFKVSKDGYIDSYSILSLGISHRF